MVHPVRLLQPTMTTTSYGDAVPDWSRPPQTVLSDVGWFTRTSTDEMAEGREAITDLYELTMAASSPINAAMRVEFAGDTFEIRGSIEYAEAPEGTHHVVARLRRVEG